MRFSSIEAPVGANFALLLVAVILLPGCQLAEESGDPVAEEPPRAAEPAERRVFLGNVSLVNESSGFVLIKTPVNQRLTPGAALQSFRDGHLSAELLFSPEQSFGFMTADISDGAPAVGDEVFLQQSLDFKEEMSPRMQQAMAQYEMEKNMSFLERRKYQRKKNAMEKKKRGGADQ